MSIRKVVKGIGILLGVPLLISAAILLLLFTYLFLVFRGYILMM